MPVRNTEIHNDKPVTKTVIRLIATKYATRRADNQFKKLPWLIARLGA